MASQAPTDSSELSAAQKLMQKHAEAPHTVTVEDVPDEELPVKASNDASGSWAAPMSSKAAGKQKESAPTKTGLDTQSHELFPELGAPKGKSANVAPIWGAKNGKANGAGSNGASRSSTPVSGAATPSNAKPAFVIPGRNVETVTLEPQFIMPRVQLKRPIPDIIKDINRKSRANISMFTAANGHLRFDATGPQDVAQQALKDLVSQIGTRVCALSFNNGRKLTFSDFHQGSDSSIHASAYYRSRWVNDQGSPGEDWGQDSASKGR